MQVRLFDRGGGRELSEAFIRIPLEGTGATYGTPPACHYSMLKSVRSTSRFF